MRIHKRPCALDVTRDRAASRFDLARGDALRLHRLQAELAEVQRGAALGDAMDAALELPCGTWCASVATCLYL
jgi:hypothetical protein